MLAPTSSAPASPGPAVTAIASICAMSRSAASRTRSKQRQNAANVVARRQFRHDAAVGDVHIHLRVQLLREQTAFAIEQRKPCLVARSFDSENQHAASVSRALLAGCGVCGLSDRITGFPDCASVQSLRGFELPMPTIRLKENEPFEVALRRFKRTIEKSGLLTELRAREFYEKPTAERKRKRSAAIKRHFKRLRGQMLPKKLY